MVLFFIYQEYSTLTVLYYTVSMHIFQQCLSHDKLICS